MKIENIKINAYGNLENKEINLKDKINIIHGANESGKSTLLNFIVSSFYGISKNKDGKELSDYDKYKPWNNEEFSGRIKYKLNNNEEYEVFRDFKKKNPKIYNEKLEDISNQFEVDKKDGNKFFAEQTGIDKQMYTSTVVSMQEEVRLDDKNQNILIQKIANLAGTGDDNISFKKVIAKLQEKIRDEIGTNKTTLKPINIIEKEVEEINKKIEEIKPQQNKKYNIDNEKEEISKELEETQLEKTILLEIKENIDKETELFKEKEIKQNNKKENILKIEELEKGEKTLQQNNNEISEEINNIKEKIKSCQERKEELNANTEDTNKKRHKSNNFIYIIVTVIMLAMSVIMAVMVKNYILTSIFGILTIAGTVIFVTKTSKEREKNNKKNINLNKQKEEEVRNIDEKIDRLTKEIDAKENIEKELSNKIAMIKGQTILLEKNNEQTNSKINEISEDIKKLEEERDNQILEKFSNKINNSKIRKLLESKNLKEDLVNIEEKINNCKIKIKGLEIEENTILPQLDNLVNLEERLEADKEEYKNLKRKEEVITKAIENLEEAYEEMKTTITPKFTTNLSSSIKTISNNKYNKVTINDENGMVVENSRGEYIEAGKLSTGTIDQLYLSLRLSMIDELSKESLPIILDETFAYFDNNRLENVIKYLNDELNNHQAIIFTCSNREKDILEKLNIKYNLVEL